jgi:hypothetical protein
VKRIKSLGVKSVFRLSLVVGSVAGLLYGVFLMIDDFMQHQYLEGIVYLFAAPFFSCILGACSNALMAMVYNLAAARLGGIEIDLE